MDAWCNLAEVVSGKFGHEDCSDELEYYLHS